MTQQMWIDDVKIIVNPSGGKSLKEEVINQLNESMKDLKEKYPDLDFEWSNLKISGPIDVDR